jgi:hypothetical protein
MGHRVLAVITALSVLLGAGGAPGTGATGHTIEGFSPAEEAVIGWALGLFEQAGLRLPGIDFRRHEPGRACGGRPGWHEGNRHRSSIAICTEATGAVGEFLVLHEIAHAWDLAVLTDERRQAFGTGRGLRAWWGADPDHWHEYGAEQAAEVLVWGLIDRPARMSRLPRPFDGCAELLTGYRLLTGRDPLHGFTGRCRTGAWPPR